jgi:hypothetical protein
MEDYEDFDLVFGSDNEKHYPKATSDEIVRHRQELGGQLFIDRLLTALGINDGEIIL